MKNVRAFWNWFTENKNSYTCLDNINNKNEYDILLDELLDHLHEYCSALYFQIANSRNCNELIITADGDKSYFQEVETLVNGAPRIEDWCIIAFKQPMKGKFVIDYEGINLDPQYMWFMPLMNESIIGLRVYINDYEKSLETKQLEGIYQVIDTLLGEKSSALDIGHLEIEQLPNNPENDGLIELESLKDYIAWKKNNLNR